MLFWEILMGAALAVGVFFTLVGVIGVLTMPDFFARAQAATCITTMGTIGAILACLIYAAVAGLPAIVFVKLVMICVLIMLSSAIAGHALDKGTYKRGHRPHGGGFVEDDYRKDGFDEL